MFETLECRRLCSDVRHARPVYSVDGNGTLHISGSVGRDVIVLSGHSGKVTANLNGRVVRVTQPVRRAEVYGGAGDDFISGSGPALEDKDTGDYKMPYGDARFPIYADGGTGRDVLYPTYSGSTLLGGGGDDRLEGMYFDSYKSHVYMDGGPGDDLLEFGNVMHGGPGRDVATIDSEYGHPVFTSGFEEQRDLYKSVTGDTLIPRDRYQGDLTTRDGRMVLSYFSDGDYERSISSPYLRPDGQIGVTVRVEIPKEGHYPPQTRWTVRLSARYTKRALSRGLVLDYVGTSNNYANDASVAWQLVLPSRAGPSAGN